MGRRIKKVHSLGLFYFGYILLVLITDLVIAATVVIVLLYSFGYNLIYPANYEEREINAREEKIRSAEQVTPDMIPELCEYVLLDFDGNVKTSTMTTEENRAAWDAVRSNQMHQSYRGNYYYVIHREEEHCVIQYQVAAQFASTNLREKIKHPETIFIILIFSLLIIPLILYSAIWGHMMKKKMKAILDVTEKIRNQDLEFEIKQVNVKEINLILSSLEKLRSELKNSFEMQWKNEEQKTQQISSLAHDLKTPLTIVKGNSELLYDMDPTEEQRECLDYISEYSDKMSEYIKELIETTRRKSNVAIEFKKMSSAVFFAEIKSEVEALCKANGIELIFNCELNGDINISKELLHRAIMNIVDNGVAFSPENGKITILVKEKSGDATISIMDEGKGFSLEGLKKATSQFYMEDKSRNGQKHFGVGLYEANETVKLHEGTLTLENNADKGACVTISIPFV